MKKIMYLILLFTITISVMYYINYKEGFKDDYSDYKTIDRVKTSYGKYAYCIAGNVTCPSGKLVGLEDYKGGKTYNYLCDDKSVAECRDNFQYKMDRTKLDWKTPTARGVSFPYSDELKGFSVPYTYIPVDICHNFINFYNEAGEVIDNINKCEMLNTERDTYKCNVSIISEFAELLEKGITSFLDDLPIGEALAKYIYKNGKPAKCIANYGTTIGKPLCCGQTGVLQKSATEYVCPATSPTCKGYTCGDKYGTCS